MLVSLLLHAQGDNEPKEGWGGDFAAGALMTELAALREENQRLASALRDKEEALAVALARCEEAEHDARTDALTGLPNRRWFMELAGRELALARRYRRPFSLVMIDIDHFKRINDEHGHPVGDQSLRLVAVRTRGKLRKRDFLGRYGGDEMLVILPDTAFDSALVVAEHLRAAVNNRPLTIDGRAIETSLSLGVAQLAAGETFERLLERVDVALYSSKSAGRDRVTGDLSPQPGDA